MCSAISVPLKIIEISRNMDQLLFILSKSYKISYISVITAICKTKKRANLLNQGDLNVVSEFPY